MMGLIEIVELQGEVIRLQSKVVDELFLLVLQHVDAEEAAGLPVMEEIEETAKMSQELNRAAREEGKHE